MKKIVSSVALFALPVFVLAESNAVVDVNYLYSIINSIQGLLNTAVPVLVGLAVVFFIWNVFGYIRAKEEAQKKGAVQGMIWGLVGIAVIVSIWGLVGILQGIGGVNGTTGPQGVDNLLPR